MRDKIKSTLCTVYAPPFGLDTTAILVFYRNVGWNVLSTWQTDSHLTNLQHFVLTKWESVAEPAAPKEN